MAGHVARVLDLEPNLREPAPVADRDPLFERAAFLQAVRVTVRRHLEPQQVSGATRRTPRAAPAPPTYASRHASQKPVDSATTAHATHSSTTAVNRPVRDEDPVEQPARCTHAAPTRSGASLAGSRARRPGRASPAPGSGPAHRRRPVCGRHASFTRAARRDDDGGVRASRTPAPSRHPAPRSRGHRVARRACTSVTAPASRRRRASNTPLWLPRRVHDAHDVLLDQRVDVDVLHRPLHAQDLVRP